IATNHGVEPVIVDVFSDNIMQQISACEAFMWRCDPTAYPRVYARRLLYAVEKGLGIPVFPALGGSWHYEDKLSQTYYLSAAGMSTSSTHIFWTREQAQRFCEAMSYPFVLKLATGYRAANVRLIHTREGEPATGDLI